MDTLAARERYQRLNGHFQACAELTRAQCRDYVSRLQLSDPDLAIELERLLHLHQTTPESVRAVPAAAKPVVETAAIRRGRKLPPAPLLILAAGAVAFAAVLGIQSWTLNGLERHLRSETGHALRTTLDYRISGMRTWASRQKDLARAVLENPQLSAEVATLADVARNPDGLKERLLHNPAYGKVSEWMLQVAPELGGLGFVVVSPSGLILCSDSDLLPGRATAPAGAAYLRRVNLGEWILSRPYPDRLFALGMSPEYQKPVMFVGGPVYDSGGAVIAMAVFRFSPDRFYEFLAPTTAEFVAFDEKSLLLNRIDDVDSLKRFGVLPDLPGAGTAFRAYLRDPGVLLESGAHPEAAPDSWPPTLMSRSAVQGLDGVDDSGHRDLRGRQVLAAWKWLPEWEMGVGNQIPVERVLAPTRLLRTVFHGTLSMIALGTLGLLVTSRYVRVGFRSRSDNRFGSYVLERPIGKGGMAEVFKARHTYLKRPAAVKILNSMHPDPGAIDRFEREARLTSRLGHPNTIQIFDYGETADGRLYYVMEYVAGLSLAQLLSLERILPVARIVYLLKQIAGSLEEAHQIGLYHRDLKPSNVMLCNRGGLADLIKVLDFGIACSVSGPEEDLTRSIGLMGTPAFIAPERIRDPKKIDPRSDIYSFGAVAFHLLTGRNVFEGAGPSELIYQVLAAERPSPSQIRGGQIPEALEDLVLRCLSVDVESRPASFNEIEGILQSIGGSDGWSQDYARRWWASNREKVAGFVEATA